MPWFSRCKRPENADHIQLRRVLIVIRHVVRGLRMQTIYSDVFMVQKDKDVVSGLRI